MQIQIGDSAEQRYPVKYYGCNPKGSVIVSAPKTGADKLMFIREGQVVTMRFVAKNVASGFTTRVLVTRGQPYPYLHLDIPKEIQTVEVRKEVRVATALSVTVINKTHSSPALGGKVTNMSCSGFRLESSMKMALQDNKLNVTMKFNIEGIEKLVTMDTVVTYVKEKPEEELYIYGVNIDDIDDDDMISLRAFVYQELLRSLHMI
ncbi:flagellar brake protein [Aliikangiella sp. G2MR2-5]|uniref:flagellar brake protein n=1 Tax=Aliikangiella sp. G2MR2-5 TaxID=2788943 RepID=UPI0018A90C19|nr:flagellar brake protein [Aliikangiella sp. G2MR2-5]